jgi:hypothetical protein
VFRFGSALLVPVAQVRPRLRVVVLFLVGWLSVARVGVGGVAPEEREGTGRVGEDADGCGAADLDRISITLRGEDVGDPVHGGHERQQVQSVAAGDQRLDVVLVDPADGDEPAPPRLHFGGLSSEGGGGLDGGIQDQLEPGPGQRPDQPDDPLVHRPGLLSGELPGGGGDPAGLPRADLAGEDLGPQVRQPVPQVQGVGDQLPRPTWTGLQHQPELGRAVGQDLRRALPADENPVVAGQLPPPSLGRIHRSRQRGRGVLVGPVRRQSEQIAVGLGAEMQVRLGRGQGAAPIQTGQIRLVEHAYESTDRH